MDLFPAFWHELGAGPGARSELIDGTASAVCLPESSSVLAGIFPWWCISLDGIGAGYTNPRFCGNDGLVGLGIVHLSRLVRYLVCLLGLEDSAGTARRSVPRNAHRMSPASASSQPRRSIGLSDCYDALHTTLHVHGRWHSWH